MSLYSKRHLSISRRDLLGGAAGLAIASHVPNATHGMTLESLSSEVIAEARRLAAGRSVTLQMLIPEGSQDNVTPVISLFSRETGIAVEPTQIALEEINTHLILNSFAGQKKYDVALPATFGMPDLVAAGVLLPLSEFARIHEPSGLRSGILYDVGDKYDDEIYGFQTDGDTYVMFYNAELLNSPEEQRKYSEQTGTALDVPQTWQELDRQLAFFHRPDDGLYGGALFRTSGYLAWEWWVRFHAKGVWPFSLDMTPQIASDEGVAALSEMIDASQYLVPEAETQGLFQNWERYGRGDVYCNIGWGGTQKYLNSSRSNMRNKLAFGPTPGGEINGEILQTPYFNWGWNYVVVQSSPEPELAYLFSLFANAPDISTMAIRAPGGYFDPYRDEHYADPEIREVYSDEFLKVHRDSLTGSIPDLYIANQSEYFGSLNNWLSAAHSKEISPKVALERAAQEWSLITIKAGISGQQKRWAKVRSVYPETVKKFMRDL